MNILYLAHRIPFPPNKGDKLRSFHQLRHLAKRHRIWCACFVDDPADGRHVNQLRELCAAVAAIRLRRPTAMLRGLAGLARGGTLTESFYRQAAMRQAIRRWGETVRFDAVVAFSSSMAPYALEMPAARHVLDLCDLDSRKWLDYAAASRGPARWLYRKEGERLAVRERAWLQSFDATILITEEEAAPLSRSIPSGQLHIVGNGVTLPDPARCRIGSPFMNAPPESAPHAAGGHTPRAGPTIGFVGAMDYRPNVDAVGWFVSRCWHSIRAAFPRAVFRIVGRSPARRVRRLAAVDGVEVVGGVADLAAEWPAFDVSVAPLRIARGLQNKVLEAMAWARPVVLTSFAAEGIGARSGGDYLVADRPLDFAAAVIRLLRRPNARRRIGLAGRRYVARHHRWPEVLRSFELIVTGMVTRATPIRPPHEVGMPSAIDDPRPPITA